jgi:hypothetical protein
MSRSVAVLDPDLLADLEWDVLQAEDALAEQAREVGGIEGSLVYPERKGKASKTVPPRLSLSPVLPEPKRSKSTFDWDAAVRKMATAKEPAEPLGERWVCPSCKTAVYIYTAPPVIRCDECGGGG